MNVPEDSALEEIADVLQLCDAIEKILGILGQDSSKLYL